MSDEIVVRMKVLDAKALCYGPLNLAMASRSEETGSVRAARQAVADALYASGHRMPSPEELAKASDL